MSISHMPLGHIARSPMVEAHEWSVLQLDPPITSNGHSDSKTKRRRQGATPASIDWIYILSINEASITPFGTQCNGA
jgi:hypothetical protein